MRWSSTLLTSCALTAFSMNSAFADCADELAALSEAGAGPAIAGTASGGVASNTETGQGTTTTFTESGETKVTTGSGADVSATDSESISKDGSLAPLEGEATTMTEADPSTSATTPAAEADTNVAGNMTAPGTEPDAATAGDETVTQDGLTKPLDTDTAATVGDGASDSAETPPVESDASAGNAAVPDPAPDAATTGSGAIVKDGSTMPLQDTAGTAKSDVAMSAQDVEAQQEGADTAAATASGGPDVAEEGTTAAPTRDPTFTAALVKAQMALEEGDEDACMAAVEEARAIQD